LLSVFGLGDRGGLFEREREMARADRELDRVGGGVGSVVVVEGPAGIGKTEVLAVVRDRARARAFGVLFARGSEFESEIAFGVARQLFEPLFRTTSARERRRLVDGLARVGTRALGVEEGEPPADRFAAIHGLFWLCANAAERGPLVVVVDDVQWVDDPSLAWLGYLARRVEDVAVLVVVGLRAGDPGGERPELVSLAKSGRERIALEPLSATAVRLIVRGQFGENAEEPFCLACRELTGGNPLFVRELLAAAREQGLSASAGSVQALRRIVPSAVGTSVLGRLGRLEAEAVALARAVAVLGAGTDVVLAARLAELDVEVAELTADRLAAAQILAPVRPLEFFHPLVGAAVLEDIAPGARRVAHRRAAALVEDEGRGSLARVAAHLLACGTAGDPWVVQRLDAAAREALERGAPEIAASYARRALAEPPAEVERAALLLLLGIAEWRAGQPDAIAHLEQALAAAGDDLGTVIVACSQLAAAYTVSDQAELAVAVLERALGATTDADGALASTFEAAMAVIGIGNERTAPPALRRADGLRDRLPGAIDPPVYLLVALAIQSAWRNHADEAQELAERALASEPYPPPLEVCNMLIVLLTLVESYDTVDRLCEDLLATARRRGAMHETVAILASRASALCDRGALADAEADARWALEHAEGIRRIHAVSEVIRVLIERDELDAAEAVLEQCSDPRSSGSTEVVRFLIARGRLRAAQGRAREALEDFLECGRRCERLELSMLGAVSYRGDAALIHAALGNRTEAGRLAREQVDLARAFGRPRALGTALCACGLVEGGQIGLELLAKAVTTLEGSQSPLELARARALYGAALRRAGLRVQARAELQRALDLAHHCGARRIANHARAEVIAVGAKPRRDAITGRDALTVGELRVARLAADGLSNREIAQALFITTNTAKAHLGRVYRKLGVTRRDQLARGLADQLTEAARAPSRTAASIS
jgi:DNA-binding CsgD family transcriptional regulator